MKTVTCAFCGKEKILTNKKYYKGIRRGNKRFFCDSKCSVSYRWPTGKNTALCENCKTSFPKKPYRMESSDLDFCSHKCRGEYKASHCPGKFVKCQACSKLIWRTLAHLERYKTCFCDLQCSRPYQSKLYRKYSSKRIRTSASQIGCNYKDIEKYPELQEILEIHALNLELKKTIKEKFNERHRNQKQRRPPHSPS